MRNVFNGLKSSTTAPWRCRPRSGWRFWRRPAWATKSYGAKWSRCSINRAEGVLDRPVWHAVGTRFDGSDDVMIGRRIAHFEIVDRLGEGGMGAVYKARDGHLDRDVALKVLLPEAVGNADRRQRFVREAKAASGLNHPNIVHVYDIDEADGELFIAMEYVAGKTLDRRSTARGCRCARCCGMRFRWRMRWRRRTQRASCIAT